MSEAETFVWPEGKRAAVSLSFDDARPSQITEGLPILEKHGVKATFYVNIQRASENVEGWKQAVAQGHEIGNHSVRHPCSANFLWKALNVLENYSLEQIEDELLDANGQIEQMLGVTPQTFAYPCGQDFVGRGLNRQSYVPVVADHFLAGRGFREEHLNAPTICDLAKLAGTELDGQSFEQLVALVKRGAENGCWIVFAGHEVQKGGYQTTQAEALDAFCAYCKAPANGVWLDTVAAVAGYIEKNRTEP